MIFVGVDPGAEGGLVALYPDGITKFNTMPDTELDIWNWFDRVVTYADDGENQPEQIVVCIEEITPGFSGTGKSQMAKLYGSYMALRMAITSVGLSPFHQVTARQWHKALGIKSRCKSESPSRWKNRLKNEAQKRFPKLHITLNTADALLIAYYCRQINRG